MNALVRGVIVFCGLLLAWDVLVKVLQLPPYILPTPMAVLHTGLANAPLIIKETIPTVIETVAGLVLGTVVGCVTAIFMAYFRIVKRWMLPLLLISQAIPTFAIAPLLVIWCGYGMTAKIVTTIIMLFFPVTSAFFDGLRRTDPGWLALATTMNAKPWRTFWLIRIPAALPALASGLRVATALAPLGAVVGEWVGASQGLGFLMLNANSRMQIDLMFAALFTLVVFSLTLYFSVDKLLRIAIPWQTETI
jgi:putative hydroxymethylpyrimidine transport system permease protein